MSEPQKDSQHRKYLNDYSEVKWIGRGNFGSAFLVHNNETKDKFVAKKIMLGQLPEKEQQNALLEVNLLRYLDHPNIVDYIGSYVEEGSLIIIMEYCDVGDLSYHIKKRNKEEKKFTEDEVLNWFIQISMALVYIHSKKVLHRDIKASNIFLTGNNTVKLGDFGISRLLENTCDAAQTVVGTPYYMSPEVCENKPYTYKSDVWALGCVLYELWTLEHAFSANNLLGLVYKIVQDKQGPIPDFYSPELKNIVEILLVKDSSKRPLVSDLLMTPFCKEKMELFIANGGFTEIQNLHVRKLKAKKADADDLENAKINEEVKIQHKSKSFNEDSLAGLKPKEQAARRKRIAADAKGKILNEHARDAMTNYSNAQQMKYNQIYNSGSDAQYDSGKAKKGHKSQRTSNNIHHFETENQKLNQTNDHRAGIAYGDSKNIMVSNYWAHPIDEKEEFKSHNDPLQNSTASSGFGESFAANDRWEQTQVNHHDENEDTFAANDRDIAEDTFTANDRCEDTFAANDRFGDTKVENSMGADTFKLSESNGTSISNMSLESSVAKTIKNSMQKASSYDDRRIVSTGRYDPEEYYYNYEAYQSDEFEDEDDTTSQSTKVEAEKDPQELTWIMSNYKHFLNNDQPLEDTKDEEFKKEQEKFIEEVKKIEDVPINQISKIQNDNKKEVIKRILGDKLYDKIYNILVTDRKSGTEEKAIYKKIRKILPNKDPKIMSKWVDLDMIVFLQIQKGEM